MFPIRDHTPSGTTPIITYSIIAINVLVFLSYFPAATDRSLMNFFAVYAFTPAIFSAGDQMYTLITSMFLHGSWMHLGGNMLFLFIFGDNIEGVLGKWKFLLFYIAGGLSATFLQYIADTSSVIPNVGASGAIAAVMGAYLVWFPNGKIDMLIFMGAMSRFVTVPAFMMLLYWIGLQMLSSFLGQDDGVAYLAHIGGFLFGVVFAFFWKKNISLQTQ